MYIYICTHIYIYIYIYRYTQADVYLSNKYTKLSEQITKSNTRLVLQRISCERRFPHGDLKQERHVANTWSGGAPWEALYYIMLYDVTL